MEKTPIKGIEEIELGEILRIVWKRRYLIIAGTMIITFAVGIISFLMPKVYTVGMVLQPGFLTVTAYGRKSFIDSVENIKELIETGELSNKIFPETKSPKILNEQKPLKFKVRILRKSNIVKVLHENKDLKNGMDALNKLKNLLLIEYGELVKYYQSDYDIKIKMKSIDAEELDVKLLKSKKDIDLLIVESATSIKSFINEISYLNERIDLNKRDLSILEQRKDDLQKEIGSIRSNTANFKMDMDRDIGNQIYQKQTEINYFENRKRDLEKEKENVEFGKKYEIENLQSTIINLENQKKFVLEEIQLLEFKRNSIQNIQIIQNPTTTPYSAKPKVLLNTILAFLAGIFLMIFITSILENKAKG